MDPTTLPQPDTTGAGGVQPPASNQGQLDPSIVALTKAIGKSESGGKYGNGDYTGDGANSFGAYQMTPGFLEEWAPKAGVQYQKGMKLSPTQQDQIAYNTVKTLGTTGEPNHPELGKLSPAQIASYWNTNHPNAYLDPNYGRNNTYGSTAKYVDDVAKNYDSYMAEQGGQSNAGLNTANAASSAPNTGIKPPSISGPAALGLGGAGALALALPWLLGPEVGAPVDAGEAAVAAAGAGEAAAGGAEGVTAEGGGILSKLWGMAKSALGIEGGIDLGKTAINAFKGSGEGSGSGGGDAGSNGSGSPDISSFLNQTPQAIKGSHDLSNALAQALEGTIGGRKILGDTNGKEAIGTMGQYGMAPTINSEGVMDFSQARDKANQNLNSLGKGTTQMLNAGGGVVPMHEAKQEAYRNIENDKNLNESERKEARAAVDSFANDYHEKYGDGQGNMSEGHMHKMKMEMGSGFDRMASNGKNAAKRALARGAKSTILKHTKHKELYTRALKEEQKLINAKKIMDRLDKKKAPHNDSIKKLLHTAGARYLALYIGDKIGGPMGAIIGSMTADYVTKRIDKKYGKTIFETPAVHEGLRILQKDNPQFYKVLEHALKKAGVATPKEQHKMLPAPRTIYGQAYKGKQEPGLVIHSKLPPKDYETAKRMKHGKPQYGGLYEKQKEIELAKKVAGLIKLKTSSSH